MLVGFGVNELNVDADRAFYALDPAFQKVSGLELLADLPEVPRVIAVLHDGRSPSHAQVVDPGELCQDLVVDAVSEVLVLLPAAPVLQRQDGNRGPAVRLCWASALLRQQNPADGHDHYRSSKGRD